MGAEPQHGLSRAGIDGAFGDPEPQIGPAVSDEIVSNANKGQIALFPASPSFKSEFRDAGDRRGLLCGEQGLGVQLGRDFGSVHTILQRQQGDLAPSGVRPSAMTSLGDRRRVSGALQT
jgi:hypothetical protein